MKKESATSIIFIVGPTASGKSTLALELAQKLDGEIVCADSQTIRRGLDIGSAKPTIHDQALVKHYLLDIVNPYENFSVAQFKRAALKAVSTIQHKGKLPIIVGGSGLYIDALFYDYSLNVEESQHDKEGYEKLSVMELQELIKKTGYEMPNNNQNKRHLVGVLRRKGKSPLDSNPIDGAHIYGLCSSGDNLKKRIVERVERMFAEGLVEEVISLEKDYGKLPARFDAIGYTIVARYVRGEIGIDDAKTELVRVTWQYARRQKSWFKRNPYILWFNPTENALEYICKDVASS